LTPFVFSLFQFIAGTLVENCLIEQTALKVLTGHS